MALAGIYSTFGNVLVQFIITNMNASLQPVSFFLVRSVYTAAVSALFLLVAQNNPFPNKRAVILLLMSAMACACGILFVFIALDEIPVGDDTVIFLTSPIMTVIMGFFFLKQKCSAIDIVCVLFNSVGIIIMTQPSFLFEKQEALSHEMCKLLIGHSRVLNMPGSRDYIIGVVSSLLGSLCFAVFYILTQYCSKNLDVMVTLFYVGIVGTFMSISVSADSINHLTFGNNWKVSILLFFVAFLSFIHVLFIAEALLLEEAGTCAMIRNADSIYAFVLQYAILKVSPQVNTLTGGIIVVISTTGLAIYRYFNAKNTNLLSDPN